MSTDKQRDDAAPEPLAVELDDGQLNEVVGGTISASTPPEPVRVGSTVTSTPPDPVRTTKTRSY